MALDFTLLKDSEALLVTYLKENNPELDLSRGTGLRDTVIKLAASGLTLIRKEAAEAKESFSLKNALESIENLEGTDTSIIDNLVSNWFTERHTGSKALGYLKVEVDKKKDYIVPSDFSFFVDELEYLSIGRTPISALESEGPYALYEMNNGNYFFLVPVIAADLGVKYNQVAGVVFSDSGLDSNVVKVSSYEDLTGGEAEETNNELVARTKQGITVRDLNTRKSIPYVLRDNFQFLKKVQVIGYGDSEMQRDVLDFSDQVLVNNIHFGGCIDTYVRTSELPVIKSIIKTVSAEGTVTLTTPDVPVYKIYSVAELNGDIIFDDFEVSYGNNGDISHRVSKVINSRFTSYEVVTISGLESYAGQDIDIRAMVPENISTLQAFVDHKDNRVVACVNVIRALIPVIIETNISYKSTNGSPIDEVGLAKEIAEYVNSVDPDTDLKTSEIAAIAQRFPNVDSIQLPINLRVEIQAPDGSVDTYSTPNIVQIPNRPSICLSRRTVNYFCDASSGISFSKLS